MKKRILYLDILRIIACLGVIANHTNIILTRADIAIASVSHSELWGGIAYMVICKVAVTLFLMISGCLLLKKIDSYKKIFMRIFKVASVLAVFSAFYYFTGDYEHTIAAFIKTATRTNVTTAFWYMYMYLGILVMLPVIQKMIKNFTMKDYVYFLVFSLGFCSFAFVTNYNAYFDLPIFVTFIGIFILGYFLDNYINIDRIGRKLTVAVTGSGFVLVTAFLTVLTYKRVMSGSETAFRFIVYDNVFYVFMAICLFILAKALFANAKDNAASKVITYIGSCTFGIYLFSDYVIGKLMPAFYDFADRTHVYMLFVVIVLDILVFAIGTVVVSVLKLIPGIKKFL